MDAIAKVLTTPAGQAALLVGAGGAAALLAAAYLALCRRLGLGPAEPLALLRSVTPAGLLGAALRILAQAPADAAPGALTDLLARATPLTRDQAAAVVRHPEVRAAAAAGAVDPRKALSRAGRAALWAALRDK